MNIKHTRHKPATSSMYVKSVEKAFFVLYAFTAGNRTLSLSEIAKTAGITKSSAQRFTHTLAGLGLIRQDPASQRWELTPRTLAAGTTYLASDPLIEKAIPHLVDLNHLCGESVNLSEPDGLDMVFLSRFTSHARPFVHMPIGTRIPMYCAASGRAYLSGLRDQEAQAVIRKSTMARFTAHTLVDTDRILTHIAEARERNYASASEEYYIGDLSIAAPVHDKNGCVVGAVNVSCPTSRWTLKDMEAEIAPMLLETVRCISGRPSSYMHSHIT